MSIIDSTHWKSWVRDQIQTSQNAATDAVLSAVADVMAAELKTYQKAEDEIAALRGELAAVKTEVAELRVQVRVRSAIDSVESRLTKLEAPLARLRAAG
jgi:predicted  nucleic acid-binding Zn-ribbon protein